MRQLISASNSYVVMYSCNDVLLQLKKELKIKM